MSAHAPTPWYIHKLGFDVADIGSKEANAITCTAFGIGVEQTEATAAFIVQACNAHDELVAALNRAKQLCEEVLPKFNWGKSCLDANAIQLLNEVPLEIRAALNLASAK